MVLTPETIAYTRVLPWYVRLYRYYDRDFHNDTFYRKIKDSVDNEARAIIVGG